MRTIRPTQLEIEPTPDNIAYLHNNENQWSTIKIIWIEGRRKLDIYVSSLRLVGRDYIGYQLSAEHYPAAAKKFQLGEYRERLEDVDKLYLKF